MSEPNESLWAEYQALVRQGVAGPRDFKRWASSMTPEGLSLAADLFLSGRVKLDPPISFAEYHELAKKYVASWLSSPQVSMSGDTRYLVAHWLANWIRALFYDASVPRAAILEYVDILRRLYVEGDEDTKRCVVDGTVEHLFEDPNIRSLFEAWKDSPDMGQAYREAEEWVHHPDTGNDVR